jgi:phytoene synthase
MAHEADAAAGFVAKWAELRPEFALASRFPAGPAAGPRLAFACIAFELEHAAFSIEDDSVAAAKLAWWAEEFLRLHDGSPQHPLTRGLLAHGGFPGPVAPWQDAIVGAMAQREAGPAADLAALLAGFRGFCRPIAEIESQCIGGIDVETAARAAALSHAVRACAELVASALRGTLALPLDRLARHGLSRHDLGVPGAARSAALREHLATLAECARGPLDTFGLGVMRRAALVADRARAQRAARDAEPSKRLQRELGRVPIAAAWAAWRAARRMASGPADPRNR